MKPTLLLLATWLMIANNLFAQGGQGGGHVSPVTQTISSGQRATINHQGGLTPRQWQQNTTGNNNSGSWTDIPGATGTSFTTPPLINNGVTNITIRYRVRTGQSVFNNTFSGESIVIVTPAPRAGTITPSSQMIVSGGSVTLRNSGAIGARPVANFQ